MIDLGTLFIEFCFEVGRPGDQKTLISLRFFSFFAISANLPTRGHMIDFLVNLALNLALKIHQKSTQEPPKIYKKSIKNNIQDMIPFFTDFPRFWRFLGTQVGSKIHKKLIKIRSGGVPKSSRFFDWFWGRILMPFSVTWFQLGRQKLPKIDPSWFQNPSEKGSRC